MDLPTRCSLTVNWCRPFRRRRFSTSRPSWVDIRNMNPCLRRRGRRFGCQVRFTTARPYLSPARRFDGATPPRPMTHNWHRLRRTATNAGHRTKNAGRPTMQRRLYALANMSVNENAAQRQGFTATPGQHAAIAYRLRSSFLVPRSSPSTHDSRLTTHDSPPSVITPFTYPASPSRIAPINSGYSPNGTTWVTSGRKSMMPR